MATKDVTAFVKRMNDIDRSKRRTEVFRDFCEMAYCALAKQTAPTEERAAQYEADYMACVARYRDPNDVRIMPELLAMAQIAIAPGGRDFLGAVAAEIGALDAGLGQFFTPYEVSRLMAEINLTDVPRLIEEHGFFTMEEPAAGAGGMVIAAADAVASLGYDPALTMWFEAVELNRPTFHMAYIQTTLRGLAGKVCHGNSLSMEVFSVTPTHAAFAFVNRHGDPHARSRAAAQARALAEIEAEQKEAAERADRLRQLPCLPPTTGAKQLSLFD